MSFVYKSLSEKLDKNEYVYVLSVGDVQIMAKELLGGELNYYEVDRVMDGIEWGLADWHLVMKSAILELNNK